MVEAEESKSCWWSANILAETENYDFFADPTKGGVLPRNWGRKDCYPIISDALWSKQYWIDRDREAGFDNTLGTKRKPVGPASIYWLMTMFLSRKWRKKLCEFFIESLSKLRAWNDMTVFCVQRKSLFKYSVKIILLPFDEIGGWTNINRTLISILGYLLWRRFVNLTFLAGTDNSW